MLLKSPQPRRVTLHTIGCRLNQAESAVLRDRFEHSGFVPVANGESTDVLVVNTCSVTEGAESDCRSIIRRVLRKSPNAVVAVTGCYAQTGVEALRSIKDIDLIVGSQHKMRLPEYLESFSSKSKHTPPEVVHTKKIDHENFIVEGSGQYSTTRANLKVQDGCQFMCAFCIIPFARGRERSRKLDDAVREAETLAERGHRELVLTGVNIGQYQDGSCGLLDLIQRLELVNGIDRIRISSIEPTTVPDALIDYMASSPKLCRYLHIPLQSGDDAILQAMNRRYVAKDYIQSIQRAVRTIPDLCVGTDVMVGFPGESEEAFANTLAVLHELPLAYLHVFSFSDRPGTPAVRMKGHVPAGLIKARSRELAGLSQLKRLAFYQRFVDRPVRVLFESTNENGLWMGLTDHYIKVGVRSSVDLSNTIRPVLITGIADGLAVGHLIDQKEIPSQNVRLPLIQVASNDR